MDKQTKGAWIIHHGRKIAANTLGASEYSAIDLASKAASLLARLAENKEAVLTNDIVIATAKVGGLNPKTELEACLTQLADKRLIDRTKTSVSVLGISGRGALSHAADLFDDNDPQQLEKAAITIAEISSQNPILVNTALEYISDTHKISSSMTKEFIQQAAEIGFVDAEGNGEDKLLFNGNLFRRDHAVKTKRILDSMTQAEIQSFTEFNHLLQQQGAIIASKAEKMLGGALLSKLKAAAIYDMNIVQNESGDHVFISSPGAFNKFMSPLVDDAFDHAKALVAALSYGMSVSSPVRGRIWGISLLLNKLIRGEQVGPATAIGNDYRALELEGVVQIIKHGTNGYYMRLRKIDVGQIALAVLEKGDASAAALENLPSAGMRNYTGPEIARTNFRKQQSAMSKTQTRTLLSSIRGGGSI